MKRRPSSPPEKSVKASAVAVVILAVFLAVTPLPRQVVERAYSTGIYGFLQPAITFASNCAPIAWLDILMVAVAVLFVARAARDGARNGWRRATRAGVWRALVWASTLYILFLVLWGFNYRRLPVTERLPYDPSVVTPAAAARLASLAVDRVNALHASAHAEGWVSGGAIDPSLAGSFGRVAQELGATRRGVAVGRPKRSLLDWYFQRAGVAGMTDPFFLETLVAGDLLPFERPFVVAHEWSHLAGITDEGEANLAGWLTCVRGSTGNQYSGWLFMYAEAMAALSTRDRAAIGARLGAGPRDDVRAIRERTRAHVNPQVSAVGWRVYDSYLKANRVEAGAASYAEVVRLALGLKMAFQASITK